MSIHWTECLTCIDAVHLLESGEILDRVAERAGRTPMERASFVRHAGRHQLDLSYWLNAERERANAELMFR